MQNFTLANKQKLMSDVFASQALVYYVSYDPRVESVNISTYVAEGWTVYYQELTSTLNEYILTNKNITLNGGVDVGSVSLNFSSVNNSGLMALISIGV